jgi:RND family efflux transporter MFP subunit
MRSPEISSVHGSSMNLQNVLCALLVALAVGGMSGCSAPATPPKTTAAVDLATIAVVSETARREQAWDGVVEATHQATMSAQTAGRVLELPYDVNDYVEAGAVIVRFSNVEQQSGQRRAEAQIRSAQAAFDETQANYARVAEIYQRKLVARAQLDQATAQRDSARAALEAAQASAREVAQQLDYTVVRAPYSGIVTQRFVQIGESVRAGQALIAGVSLDELRINVQVPQSAVDAIRRYHAADVLLDSEGARRITAAKLTVFPYADAQTHTFSIRLDLPPQETGLYPGMTVKTAFAIGEAERLLIPSTALVQRGEVSGVYVVAENEIRLHQVRLGHRFGDRIEVLSGLSAGDKIATDPNAAALYIGRVHAGEGA